MSDRIERPQRPTRFRRALLFFPLMAVAVLALGACLPPPASYTSGTGTIWFAAPYYGYWVANAGGSGAIVVTVSGVNCIGGIGVYDVYGNTHLVGNGQSVGLGWATNGAQVKFGNGYGPDGCTFNYTIKIG